MGQVRAVNARTATTSRTSVTGPEAILDRWVARVELAGARQATDAPTGDRRTIAKAGVRGRAITPFASPPARPSPVSAERRDAVRAALAGVSVRGSSLSFADPAGGTVVLGRSGSRIAHQGTVGVRGPCGLTLDALREHGLSEAQARGVEFAAAWFGAPFDAVSLDRTDTARSMSWGFWPLGLADTCRALALWKERAPASFASILVDYGVDVLVSNDLGGPTLAVVDPARSIVVSGRQAADALSRDPRRIALLARAGRHEDARKAQVEVVVRGAVLPLLRLAIGAVAARKTVADVATGPGAVAVLLAALRALDLTGMAEVLASASRVADDAFDESALVAAVEASLRDHAAASLAARRSLSSPELRVRDLTTTDGGSSPK